MTHIHRTEVVKAMSGSPQAGLTKNGARNVVDSTQMKFASAARLRSVFPFQQYRADLYVTSGTLYGH